MVEFPSLSDGSNVWCGNRITVDGWATRAPWNFPNRCSQENPRPSEAWTGHPRKSGRWVGRATRLCTGAGDERSGEGATDSSCLAALARRNDKGIEVRGIPP